MSFEPSLTVLNKKQLLELGGVFKLLLIGLFFILASVVIIEVEFLPSQIVELQVNDISPQDIVAPFSISYESQIATERARNQAAKLVQNDYTPLDPNVAREQRIIANQVFDYLDAIRVDPFLTDEQKIAYIQAVIPVSFSTGEAMAILNLNEELWDDAKQEVDTILAKVMGEQTKERDLPSLRFYLALNVSPDVPDIESDVIVSIAEDLIQPNSFVDEALTNTKRQEARDAVQPIIVTYEKNQIIIRARERVNELDIEALEAMGLHQPTDSWQNYISTFLWLTLMVGSVGYYLYKYHPNILQDNQQLVLLVIITLIFVLAIRAMVPGQTILPYALPTPALTIIIAGTLDPQLAFIVTLMIGLIEGYVAGGSFELAAYAIITGVIVALSMKRMAQVNTLLRAGFYAAISNVIIILLFRFFDGDLSPLVSTSVLTTLAQVGNGIVGGLVSAGLALVAFLIIGNITGIVTYIQLIELSRPTQPLLAELLRRAPGTYHHSLLVSNLAEQAAIRIGADAFLCRVGAYYHDVGKMVRPYFFSENESHGISLHDNLDSETSAQILISHVTDGLRLAKKYRLPPILHSFIAEHHGTEITGYFYRKAIQACDGDQSQVDKLRYTYPGPIPQSKETAILMLADASEATVRSVQPKSVEEIDQIVRKTIALRMESGQFDECELTMRDIEQIRIAFNEVLQGVAHQRVKYPDEIKEEAKVKTGLLPALPLAMQSTPMAVSNKPDHSSARSKISLPRES